MSKRPAHREPRIGCRVRSNISGRTGYVIGPPDLDYPKKVRVRWDAEDGGGIVVMTAESLTVTGGF